MRTTLTSWIAMLGVSVGLNQVALAGEVTVRSPSRPTRAGAYAEDLYAEYAAATGKSVAFTVETLERGRLVEVSGARFGDLLEVPPHRVEASQAGTLVRDPQFTYPEDAAYALHDLEFTADDFADIGLPVERGVFRRLGVSVTIAAQVERHEALELCWPQAGHCVVVDPVVVFLQSTVDNRRRLAAEGWGPTLVVGPDNDDPGAGTGPAPQAKLASQCGLASNPGTTNVSYYWRAYSLDYKNVFGITLIHKSIGAQRAGIRCNAACYPDPYGYSYNSTCWTVPPWTCQCDNDFGYGTGGYQGRTGKYVAETKCTHRFVLQGKARASVTGMGTLDVDIDWALDGGVDSNGGQIYDTCGNY